MLLGSEQLRGSSAVLELAQRLDQVVQPVLQLLKHGSGGRRCDAQLLGCVTSLPGSPDQHWWGAPRAVVP